MPGLMIPCPTAVHSGCIFMMYPTRSGSLRHGSGRATGVHLPQLPRASSDFPHAPDPLPGTREASSKPFCGRAGSSSIVGSFRKRIFGLSIKATPDSSLLTIPPEPSANRGYVASSLAKGSSAHRRQKHSLLDRSKISATTTH